MSRLGKTSLLGVILLTFAFQANGVTEVNKITTWQYDLKEFYSKSFLNIKEKPEELRMPIGKMKTRIQKSAKDDRVEPLYVPLNENKSSMKKIAAELAKDGNTESLYRYFENNINAAPSSAPGSNSKKVPLNTDAFQLLDKKSFGDRFASTHYNLTVNTEDLKSDKTKQDELMEQISPYLSSSERQKVLKKIRMGLPLDVNTELLPKFAKKMVKKFTIYKGPNCFHASLAFQNTKFTNSDKYNVKREEGYHKAMINYDELYRILEAEFYEVNPKSTPLKYGDIIVFMDIPHRNPAFMNFKWIRHTATYLFNGYTFSKGSKSPNTPYSVKKLQEEWNTWDKFTDKLAVKVFRKSGKSVKKSPARDLEGWLY